jgi:hypothetical protein
MAFMTVNFFTADICVTFYYWRSLPKHCKQQISQSAPREDQILTTLKCHLLSIQMWLIWYGSSHYEKSKYIYDSSDGNIVFWIVTCLNVAEFTTTAPLSLIFHAECHYKLPVWWYIPSVVLPLLLLKIFPDRTYRSNQIPTTILHRNWPLSHYFIFN